MYQTYNVRVQGITLNKDIIAKPDRYIRGLPTVVRRKACFGVNDTTILSKSSYCG